jgi:UDP-glucose 4-epimerase
MRWERSIISALLNEEITIQDLAKRVIKLTESSSLIERIPYDQAYAPGFEDMQRRVPSLEKINQLNGYKPRYTLEETLKRVIAYEQGQITGSKEY